MMESGRYSRQELFSGIGREGQHKIRGSAICIIGCGALGSLQSEAMARAGVSKILIVDRDFVEPSNLQRQALFTEEDAENMTPKAVAAARQLNRINSDVHVEPLVVDLNPDNLDLIAGSNLILDGTDNFQTRYLINDYSWQKKIPWIYGACVGSTGVACAFDGDAGPCLRCIFEEEPPPGSAQTCDTAGIIWPAVAAIVSFQIAAALKLLSGEVIVPNFFQTDVWEQQYHILSLASAKRMGCETCGEKLFPSLRKTAEFDSTLCGRDAVQIRLRSGANVDLDAIEARWKRVGETKRNPFLLKLLLPANELVLFPDGRAIIKGTSDRMRARDLYAKYIGL